ncbi:MAG: hypothetical protein U5J95_00585 [Balneolaceae bacterium]|nr:hypothetical protein [Balneolaceae bacterium]
MATNFFRFSTAFRTIRCQHCNEKLKLGGKAVFVLLLMVILGLAVPTFLLGINNIGFDYFSQAWMTVGAIAGYLILWYGITSVLAWMVVEFELPGDKI